MEKLNMTINGKAISVDVDPGIRLVDFLRDNLFLTGTKIGCGKGECGACTVIMNGKAVTSCIIPVMRAQGAVIETIEGLGKNGKLHPIQEEFINKGAIALVTGLIAYKAAGKETLEGRDHARVIVGSILGTLTYTALYLLKSYIKLRFTTADVDPVAIQATMLSKAASSLFNAAFAFVVAPIFFNVLRKPLRRLGLYSKD